MTYQHCNRPLLDALVVDLAVAQTPTRSLDAEIARAFGAEAQIVGKIGWKMRQVPWYDWGGKGHHWQNLSRFASDVNAAFDLARYVMPGLELRAHIMARHDLPRHREAPWSIRAAEDIVNGIGLSITPLDSDPRPPAIAVMYAMARLQQLALQDEEPMTLAQVSANVRKVFEE